MSAAGRSYPDPCEKCGVGPFEQCRSLTTGKLTDTHAARLKPEPANPKASTRG